MPRTSKLGITLLLWWCFLWAISIPTTDARAGSSHKHFTRGLSQRLVDSKRQLVEDYRTIRRTKGSKTSKGSSASNIFDREETTSPTTTIATDIIVSSTTQIANVEEDPTTTVATGGGADDTVTTTTADASNDQATTTAIEPASMTTTTTTTNTVSTEDSVTSSTDPDTGVSPTLPRLLCVPGQDTPAEIVIDFNVVLNVTLIFDAILDRMETDMENYLKETLGYNNLHDVQLNAAVVTTVARATATTVRFTGVASFCPPPAPDNLKEQLQLVLEQLEGDTLQNTVVLDTSVGELTGTPIDNGSDGSGQEDNIPAESFVIGDNDSRSKAWIAGVVVGGAALLLAGVLFRRRAAEASPESWPAVEEDTTTG